MTFSSEKVSKAINKEAVLQSFLSQTVTELWTKYLRQDSESNYLSQMPPLRSQCREGLNRQPGSSLPSWTFLPQEWSAEWYWQVHFFQARWPPKHSKLWQRLKSPRPGWDFQVEEKRWGFNRTPLSQPVLCPETWANSLHVATVGFRQGTQPSAPIWKQKTEKCQNKPTSPVSIVHYWWCSAAKSSLTLCEPRVCSTPGFSVLHYLPEFPQTHIHLVADAI